MSGSAITLHSEMEPTYISLTCCFSKDPLFKPSYLLCVVRVNTCKVLAPNFYM